jgi:ATP-binding cassette subfamily B protein
MLVRAPLLMVGSLVMAILTSVELAFIPVLLIPIEILAVIWVVQRATPLFSIVQTSLDNLNQVMQENLAGVRVVKAFVRREHEKQRFGSANAALTNQGVHAVRLVAVMPSFMMLTLSLGMVAVLWFGGVRVTQGSLQIGQVIAFVNYLMTTLFSLMMVSHLVIQLARAEASAKRIMEVMENEPQVQNQVGARQHLPSQNRVEFENVTFSYDGSGSDPVLKGVNLTAEPGDVVAILGATGSGKSSLIHLIPRFYDVSAGRVTLGGVDVRDLEQESLRRTIGIAQQEVVLFSGSIRENIRYGKPDAGDDEVIAAAKAAQAHDFILSFPDGYDTLVGQRGVNLSGGQKQRIAIARALLVNPSILILDDSTSAVDVETESKIQDALEAGKHNRISFVVAQRISTVLKASKILVLENGQVAAQGTHRELLASSPLYQDIYQSQLGNGASAHG